MFTYLLVVWVRVLIICCPCRLVFNEVVHTNKEYMRDVTTIQPEWLCELAPHFYHFGTVRMHTHAHTHARTHTHA